MGENWKLDEVFEDPDDEDSIYFICANPVFKAKKERMMFYDDGIECPKMDKNNDRHKLMHETAIDFDLNIEYQVDAIIEGIEEFGPIHHCSYCYMRGYKRNIDRHINGTLGKCKKREKEGISTRKTAMLCVRKGKNFECFYCEKIRGSKGIAHLNERVIAIHEKKGWQKKEKSLQRKDIPSTDRGSRSSTTIANSPAVIPAQMVDPLLSSSPSSSSSSSSASPSSSTTALPSGDETQTSEAEVPHGSDVTPAEGTVTRSDGEVTPELVISVTDAGSSVGQSMHPSPLTAPTVAQQQSAMQSDTLTEESVPKKTAKRKKKCSRTGGKKKRQPKKAVCDLPSS